VRRLVLVGSRARPDPVDDLADIDLQVHTDAADRFTRDEAWLHGIGRVWVCVRDAYMEAGLEVPTRLVIFDGGVKADFAFYPARKLSRAESVGRAHRVLLEKQGPPASEASPAPVTRPPPVKTDSATGPEPADETEFRRIVEEFWFEAWHVAKYLARRDPRRAEQRGRALQVFLLRMREQHARIGGARTIPVSDPAEDWDALRAATAAFRRVGTEVAAAEGYRYPVQVDANVDAFVARLRARREDRKE
jgi:aminoglycoside 6-adenylyltransferase